MFLYISLLQTFTHTSTMMENMSLIKSTRVATKHNNHTKMDLFCSFAVYVYMHVCGANTYKLCFHRERECTIVGESVSERVFVCNICSIKAKANSCNHQLRYDISTNCFSLKQWLLHGVHVIKLHVFFSTLLR